MNSRPSVWICSVLLLLSGCIEIDKGVKEDLLPEEKQPEPEDEGTGGEESDTDTDSDSDTDTDSDSDGDVNGRFDEVAGGGSVEGLLVIGLVDATSVWCYSEYSATGHQVDAHCPSCDYGFETHRVVASDGCGFGSVGSQVVSLPYRYGGEEWVTFWYDNGSYAGWYPYQIIRESSSDYLYTLTYTGPYGSGSSSYYVYFAGYYELDGFVDDGRFPSEP